MKKSMYKKYLFKVYMIWSICCVNCVWWFDFSCIIFNSTVACYVVMGWMMMLCLFATWRTVNYWLEINSRSPLFLKKKKKEFYIEKFYISCEFLFKERIVPILPDFRLTASRYIVGIWIWVGWNLIEKGFEHKFYYS